jgi:ribose 5-phosphate isomerase B
MAAQGVSRKIAIGADHGGYAMKQELIEFLKTLSIECDDCGTHNAEKCDYPDVAKAVCAKVLSGAVERGIVVCGTGIGISIACNKVEGIRCALAHDHYTAKMAREHNDANVLSLGGRTTGIEIAKVSGQGY